MASLSIIMPVLNETAAIDPALAALSELRQRGAEIIVVDGGSADATLDIAHRDADRVLSAPRGRGAQMNAGAAVARNDVLLFLHADTRLPADADRLMIEALTNDDWMWGRFDVAIAGTNPLLPLVATLMNWRAALTGIATGDQAIFVRRAAFEQVGGFPDIPLMEDIALSRALKRLGPPLRLREVATTSGRRWEKNGVLRTILLMWRLRLAYSFGADPAVLARRYGYTPRES